MKRRTQRYQHNIISNERLAFGRRFLSPCRLDMNGLSEKAERVAPCTGPLVEEGCV